MSMTWLDELHDMTYMFAQVVGKDECDSFFEYWKQFQKECIEPNRHLNMDERRRLRETLKYQLKKNNIL